jgi:hypothetical protein
MVIYGFAGGVQAEKRWAGRAGVRERTDRHG